MPASSKRIYIVPTVPGLYFGGLTFVMLLVGAGYQNNLVNLLAFFMLALLFVSMVITQAQLQDIEITQFEIPPTFAFSSTEVRVRVRVSSKGSDREGLVFQIRGFEGCSAATSLPVGKETLVQWTIQSPARGLHRISRLDLSSVFPLGLFFSWRILPVNADWWVYPKKEGSWVAPEFNLAALSAGSMAFQARHLGAAEDFHEHRKYVPGDSVRQVDWKAVARNPENPWLVKELEDLEQPLLWINGGAEPFRDLADPELRLSQLSSWLDRALHEQRAVRFEYPEQQVVWVGRGKAFIESCWRVLAQAD
jgi:uncharacterized protein (DUF58 family)